MSSSDTYTPPHSWLVRGGAATPVNHVPHSQKTKTTETSDVSTILPGYTGYKQGFKGSAGYTYGTTARLVAQSPNCVYNETGSVPFPPKIHQTVVESKSPRDSCISISEAEPKHMPGYKGFCQGTRDMYGETFGRTTQNAISGSK